MFALALGARTVKAERSEKTLAELAYRTSLKLAQAGKRALASKQSVENLKKDGFDPEITKLSVILHDKVVATLPQIKRISIEDQPTRDLLASTISIPAEDVFAQLSHVALHFDELWIELPLGYTIQGTKVWTRQGFWVKADPKAPHRFTFHIAMGGDDFADGVVFLHPMTISADGIEVDEDAVLKLAEYMELQTPSGISAGFFGIDAFYDGADLLARLLLLLGSDRLPSNLGVGKTADEEAIEKKNRQRERMNLKPLLPATPVKVDLTNIDLSDKNLTPKKLKALLGWTAVRRSKPILRKDGSYYRRSPHDRRIPSPVDRRLVAREIFVSARDVEFDLGDAERPPALIFDVPNRKATLN